MANRTQKPARRSRRNSPSILIWVVSGAVGLVVLVIAALALRSGDNNGAGGQKQFDPNFEPEVSGAPRVEVVQDDFIDYGNVKLGQTIDTVYTVRNIGNEPLVVLGEPQVELVEGC